MVVFYLVLKMMTLLLWKIFYLQIFLKDQQLKCLFIKTDEEDTRELFCGVKQTLAVVELSQCFVLLTIMKW